MVEMEELVHQNTSLKKVIENQTHEMERLWAENLQLKDMIEQDQDIKKGLNDLEKRVVELIDRKIASAVKGIMGISGAEGRVTSTPVKGYEDMQEEQKDAGVLYNPFRVSVNPFENAEEKKEGKVVSRKKTSKNRRHERMLKSRKVSKSKDSLYSSSESK